MDNLRNLKVSIDTFVDNANPGWVLCSFYDIYEEVHYFEEKVPIVTDIFLDENGKYPQSGYVRCEIVNIENGIVTVNTKRPFSIEDLNGETTFKVYENQLG